VHHRNNFTAIERKESSVDFLCLSFHSFHSFRLLLLLNTSLKIPKTHKSNGCEMWELCATSRMSITRFAPRNAVTRGVTCVECPSTRRITGLHKQIFNETHWFARGTPSQANQ
jgi:hypothetical protein